MEPLSPHLTYVDPATPFADEVRALAKANAEHGPAPHSVIFYGSSSIRLWSTLERDFPGLEVLNRGFGGSTLADGVREFDRLVAPMHPRAIVLYAGDNDLDQGTSPAELLHAFETLLGMIRARLGGIPLVLLSIKPSPIRFWNKHNICEANRLLQEASNARGVLYLDVYARMLNEHGEPHREFFGEDGLHLSPLGYALWTDAVRTALPLDDPQA